MSEGAQLLLVADDLTQASGAGACMRRDVVLSPAGARPAAKGRGRARRWARCAPRPLAGAAARCRYPPPPPAAGALTAWAVDESLRSNLRTPMLAALTPLSCDGKKRSLTPQTHACILHAEPAR